MLGECTPNFSSKCHKSKIDRFRSASNSGVVTVCAPAAKTAIQPLKDVPNSTLDSRSSPRTQSMSEPFVLGLKTKKYGLLLPVGNKTQAAGAAARSALDLADDDPSVDLKEQFSQRGNSDQRKVKAMLDKAQAEDPTVFQYDEVVEQTSARSQSFNRPGTKTLMT